MPYTVFNYEIPTERTTDKNSYVKMFIVRWKYCKQLLHLNSTAHLVYL